MSCQVQKRVRLALAPAVASPAWDAQIDLLQLLAEGQAACLCVQEGPAIIYNVPGRTGQDIPDDVILQLASTNRSLLGVKECTGNARIANYARQVIAQPALIAVRICDMKQIS